MQLPLGVSAYDRTFAKELEIRFLNRFFEDNPVNAVDSTALLSRAGTTFFAQLGTGPIRKIWSQEGTFGGAAFIVSNESLFRYEKDGTSMQVIATILNNGTPSIDGTAETVWISDGAGLYYYNGVGSFATGTLTATANFANGETVTLGSVVYTFNTVLGGANSILIGATTTESLENLGLATFAATGTGIGTKFGIGTVANGAAKATPDTVDPLKLVATAVTAGTAGNAVVSTETAANASWTGATLAGGVAQAVNQIVTPDDVGIVSIGVIGGFVLCVAANSQRVYFIRPGEFVIDPLDFFEAESIPDEIIEVLIVGDEIWLIGVASTEVWYLSGIEPIPFDRVQGRAYSRGGLEGTAKVLEETVIMVGNDGVVYMLAGGLQRISTHGIEEKIRMTIRREKENP